ncbi:MAG: type VI secretion system protein TssA [Desulfobacterales bacterium]|nr:type VI secretion system protein TssA [Desulfobacterales bacterium]
MDLSTLGSEPISGGNPAGSDVRYEPEFEELQAEIDKLSSPSAEGGIDWGEVSARASTILREKSKDLLVASYMAVSQVHLNRIDGLVLGVHIFHDLLSLFWDGLYPPQKRKRGRISAIQWWLEKTETALERFEPEPVPAETLDRLAEQLAGIDQLLVERLEDPPLLRGLQAYVQRLPAIEEKAPGPEPEKPPNPKEPEAPAPSPESSRPSRPAPSPAAPAALVIEEDAQSLLKAGLQKIGKAAASLAETDPKNALAHRLTRFQAWATVQSLPSAAGGKTMAPPPDSQIAGMLHDFREQGNWEALLNSSERRLPEFILWLDLNRFVAEALENLGAAHQDALEVVNQETAFFIHRLPGLEDLTFSDGTPFADVETRQWLKSIAPGVSSLAAEPSAAPPGDDQMTASVQRADELAKKKKLVEALQLLQEKMRGCSSEREALLWRLALCRLLIRSRKAELAAPHLEQALEDIARYRLERWDPALALNALKTARLGFDALPGEDFQRKSEEVLARIAKLDPAESLRISGGER